MNGLKKAASWLEQIQKEMKVILPLNNLPAETANAGQVASCLSRDPLIVLQVFRLVYRMTGSVNQNSLEEAIDQVGVAAVLDLAYRLPRVDPASSGATKLLQSVADSLVAASLLRSWHLLRQVDWSEQDHWACLFANLPEWLVAQADPMLLEGIEYRVNTGESADPIFIEIFGFGYEELYQAAAEYFRVPTMDSLSLMIQGNTVLAFKYQALNYYLPIANQLATLCRKEWGSDQYKKLVGRAKTATLIDDLEQALPGWLAQAAREELFPHVSDAIVRYFQNQPDLFVPGYPPVVQSVVLDDTWKDMPQAVPQGNKNSNPVTDDKPDEKDDSWLELSSDRLSGFKKPETSWSVPSHDQPLKFDKIRLDDSTAPTTVKTVQSVPLPKEFPLVAKPRGNSKLLDEYRFLFENQVVRYSNEVIALQALTETLHQGMGFTRVLIALHQPSVGQIRVQYREGTQERLQLHNLSFAIPENGIIAKMVEKPLSFWLKPENAEKAWPNLPRRFGEAVNSQDFFLKSIHVNGKFRALVYVDVYNQTDCLAADEYAQFRFITTMIERLLNKAATAS